MRKRFIQIQLVLFIILPLNLFAQLLNDGKYIGYEKMEVRTMSDGSLLFLPGMSVQPLMSIQEVKTVEGELWFHQVTITIKNDSAIISKVPIYIKNGLISYSDSTGSFYYYRAQTQKGADSSISLFGLLTDKLPPKRNRETFFYDFVIYYKIEVKDRYLIAFSPILGRLTYRKIE